MTDREAAAVISIAFIKRQAGNGQDGPGDGSPGPSAKPGSRSCWSAPARTGPRWTGPAGQEASRSGSCTCPGPDLDKRIAGYTRPDDLVITGCGQLEDHASIARAVLGSRGSGLSAERDAPPWCCVLLNRTAANAQLNGCGPAGDGP